MATLVRPVSQFLPILLVGFCIARFWRSPVRAATAAIAVIVTFSLVISPWLYRNQRVFGHAELSTVGAFVLALHIAPMEAAERGVDNMTAMYMLRDEANLRIAADGLDPQHANPFVRARYWRELAREYASRKPFAFSRTMALGIVHSFANLATSDFARMLSDEERPVALKGEENLGAVVRRFLRDKHPLELIIAAALLPFLLLSYAGTVVGIGVGWRRLDRGALAICLLIAIYFILVTGAAGLVRYRLPALPFYLPLTAVGLLAVADRIRARFSRRTGADALPE
jgi:hypothetical protein